MSEPFDPDAPPDPKTKVHFGTQLWSTQVGMAQAATGECGDRDVAYEWSSGRRHFQKRDPYNDPPST